MTALFDATDDLAQRDPPKMISHRVLCSFGNFLHDVLHAATHRAFFKRMPFIYRDRGPRLDGLINVEQRHLSRTFLQSGAASFTSACLDQSGATKGEQ